MRIAFVHDYLVQYGGAERVLECLTELYPYAPIYTILHNKEAMHGVFADKRIYTSYLQNFPFARKWHRIFPLLMPPAIEQFDFSAYDVVVSDSSSYAKGIITRPETLHICYMHTPMRYAWDDCQKYTRDFYFPRLIKKLIPFAMNYIRLWDKVSVDRVDVFIANSNFVSRRIKKYYHKESTVIHPPVDTKNFTVRMSESNEKYFLMVGRLIAYKRHSVAIRAFNEMKLPLKIIGRGPELKRLQKIAGPTIEFLSRVEDEELKKYYADCQAVIFPQEEDFGIVAIEALSSGKPLIAFRGGDIPEHMEENLMGVFFDEQTAVAIKNAVEKFQKLSFDSDYIRSKVLKFDLEIFKEKIKAFIESEVSKHNQKNKPYFFHRHSERSEESLTKKHKVISYGQGILCVHYYKKNNTVFYTGMTSNLAGRIFQHKNKEIEGFTKKYNVDKLVFYENFSSAMDAIAAEKRIKGWTRQKKIDLIKKNNPEFKDLLGDYQ